MNKTQVTFLFVASSFFAFSSAFAEGWDGYDSPTHMSRSYTYGFNALPLSGQLSADKMPWSETYWPSFRGGIAYRWQTRETGFNYALNSKEKLMAMGPEGVAKLSPAEKFDILNGRYDYPTVMGERRRVSPDAPEWTGICHGWVPAALLHKQPEPKTLMNPDGIEVRLGSSDIKGLISYYYGVVRWKPSGWIGKRCGGLFKPCRGVNAGTVHVVLANQIGLMGRGFVADVDRGREVWNQPVFAYNSKIIGQGRREVVVQTEMYYADELSSSRWESQPQPNMDVAVYRYTLELNVAGRITGGSWQTSARPGYMWQHEMNDFAHPYYGSIKGLLNDAPASFDLNSALADSALSDEEIMTMANESLDP